MKFTGSLFNPTYKGEGFALIEHDDGAVIVHFFSYELNGVQTWLIGSGQRDGNKAVADMVTTRGGRMASLNGLKNVTESPWGAITLQEREGVIWATFRPVGGSAWEYSLQPIHAVPLAEDAPEPGTVITLDQHAIPGGWVKDVDFKGLPCPLYGSQEVKGEDVGGMWYEAVFHIVKGTLTIKDISYGGPYKPKVTGAIKGQPFRAGEECHLKFTLTGPAAENSADTQSTVIIETEEMGRLVWLTAKVLH